REARLAAKLSHPNIIPIHAVDETGGFVYYVMSFVDGETLAQRVRSRGPLSASEGARVLREVAWALASAHAQGIVHRDVKPDNILIEATSHRVLVADFGIAAALGDASGDGISGTPEFMSPEQALGHEVDARSDLYSLGATGYYAFSGRLPFEGRTSTEVLARQVTEQAPGLGTLGLSVPRKMASLIDRCLAKDPAQRPANASVLADQLGVAIEQRRELPVALRAFVKRNGRLDGGGTLIVAGSALGLSILVSFGVSASAGFASLGVVFAVVPFASLVLAARSLARLGFAHGDLAPAFKAELETSREEHAVEHAKGSSRLERMLNLTAKVSFAVAGAAVILQYVFGTYTRTSSSIVHMLAYIGYSFVAPIAAVTFPFALLGYLTLLQRRSDLDTSFWAGVWNGRIGRAAWALARRLLRGTVRESANTHRATELSLGMAAENLYESLPKAARDELGALPALLRRLQDDAQVLRRHAGELQEVLSDAGEAAATAAYEPVTRDRDAVQAKLAETVGALETIRLNLLRLHAGSLTVVGLTTHIGLALDVSAEVERMLAAQSEVEHVLRFPREVALTPS
ncbi:MAG TPA: serine/threonine-protein kinase, partial [Gemmatimonadaceae bacterium]